MLYEITSQVMGLVFFLRIFQDKCNRDCNYIGDVIAPCLEFNGAFKIKRFLIRCLFCCVGDNHIRRPIHTTIVGRLLW